MNRPQLFLLCACFLRSGTLFAVEPDPASPPSGPYYFIAVHNEPFHRPGGEAMLARSYDILRRMVAKADAYQIKLTLMFSPQWADYISKSEERMREVAGWKAGGHEIAGHHHSIGHGNWDGYTDFTREEAEAARRTRGQEPEEYLGTLMDFMNSLRRLDQRVQCGCMNDEVLKRALPDGIIFDTCSGFANFGTPGRRLGDGMPEKGRNEYISVGAANGITRKWVCHFQTTSPQRVRSAIEVLSGMRLGVYGSVNHSSPREQIAFGQWLDFLHGQDPSGARSRTVSQVIEQELLPERKIPKDLLAVPPPVAAPWDLPVEIHRAVQTLKQLLRQQRAAGFDVSEAEQLDRQSRDALRRGQPEECLRLLKRAIEELGAEEVKQEQQKADH